jgi:hypothetical protein
MARRRISENPSTYTGAGMALAGLIIGWIGVALMIIGIIVVAIVFGVGASQGFH